MEKLTERDVLLERRWCRDDCEEDDGADDEDDDHDEHHAVDALHDHEVLILKYFVLLTQFST